MMTTPANTIVLDLEIQDPITCQEDWEHTEKIKISCCVVYFYEKDRYEVFGPNDLDHLRNIIIMSDRVVTFNGHRFDLPVIFGTSSRTPPELKNSYDMLREIWLSLHLNPDEFSNLHKNWGLDSCCFGTLGTRKTGHGAEAPLWYRDGNIWKVISYCINDVALTKELYEHIENNGFVRNRRNQIAVINASKCTHSILMEGAQYVSDQPKG